MTVQVSVASLASQSPILVPSSRTNGNDASHLKPPSLLATVKCWPTASLGADQVPSTVTSLEVWREALVALVTCAVMVGAASAAAYAAP